MEPKEPEIGLFFFVKGRFLFHGCPLSRAEPYGDFLVYPRSHDALWERCYHHRYGVDFDFYPRGRVVYRVSDSTFLIYHDPCLAQPIRLLARHYTGQRVLLLLDGHYQCHRCNPNYYF